MAGIRRIVPGTGTPAVPPEPSPEDGVSRPRVVFRGDDAGSCVSANEAIATAIRRGVLRNVSVMAPGPAIQHASRTLRNQSVLFGLHVTLNAEWERVRWGPVLSPTEVPSLVEPDGGFTSEPEVLKRRGFSLDEAMAEVRAQLALLREVGLRPSYLDEHMGVGELPGLRDSLERFADEEGLLPVSRLGLPYLDKAEVFRRSGVCVLHPGRLANDMVDMTRPGISRGQIARERRDELRFLLDPRLREIDSITYLEI